MIDPNESTAEEFAEAVGRAIISWQHVESSSAHLFSHLLDARGLGAGAVFYYLKNQSTRIEIMNIAARFHFHIKSQKRMLTQWKKLSMRLVEATAKRNRIAHFEIAEEMTARAWKLRLTPPVKDWSQLDPENMERWKQRQSRRVLSYSDIKSAWRDFERLADDLNAFAHQVLNLNQGKKIDKSPALSPPHAQVSDSGALVLKAHRKSPPSPKKPRRTL